MGNSNERANLNYAWAHMHDKNCAAAAFMAVCYMQLCVHQDAQYYLGKSGLRTSTPSSGGM